MAAALLATPLAHQHLSAAGNFTELPSCASPCILEQCVPQNTTCVCGFREEIASCILVSCDLPEAIYSRRITETTCETPVRDRTIKFNAMIISMTACTLPIVGMRLLYKQFCSARRRLTAEDWTIMAAVPVGLPSVALTIFGLTAHGLGKDIWGLDTSEIMKFGRYFYIIQILYIVLLALVKLTLTFFYLNIFTGRRIKRLLWATAAVHVAGALAFVIAIIFQCTPISYQWKKYAYAHDNPVSGHCIDINAAGWANGAISVVSDIWLLGIPLSQLHKLQLHWKKRLGATLMFMTGAIVTVVSFLRLASIKRYASTSNPTWDQWDIVWWSTIEVEVGLICTCLPTMRLILVRIAPRTFGSDSNTGQQGEPLSRASQRTHTRLEDEVDDVEQLPPIQRKLSTATTQYSSINTTPRLPEPVYYTESGRGAL